MGGGLERAIEELSSSRVRGMSIKMIILLTDGQANVTADGETGNYSGGAAYALEQAQLAADAGLRIFAVSVGAGADQSLMQQIADIGHGEHFHAGGSTDQYSQQLADIFRRLGGTRPVELIQ
jgi:Mg-chelatase subunit ChlD